MSLDQCGSYVSANDNSAFDLGLNDGEDFTIEAMFYVPNGALDNLQRIVSHGSQYLLAIDFNSDQPDSVQFTTTPGSQFAVVGQANIGAGWHHIAAVFNNEIGQGGDYRALFLDGSLLVSDASIQFATGVGDTTAQLRIGASDAPFGFDTYFNGLIDDVRLSNTVRYTGNYQVPTTAFDVDPSTRALWHFDEPVGAASFVDSVSGQVLLGQGGAHVAEPTWERATVVDIFGPNALMFSEVSVAAVTFSEAINLSTFDFSDLQLTSRSGTSTTFTDIPLNSQVTTRLLSGSTYVIEGLASFTNAASTTTYRLTVNADNIASVSGHSSGGCVSQNWTKTTSSFQPEISLLGNNHDIVDGDMTPQIDDLTAFGDVAIGNSSTPHVFTIRSDGSSSLHLTGIPRILVGGLNASDFVVTTQPSAFTVNPNQTTTFAIVFSPSGAGSRAAEIFILNDDSNESLYNFVVQGTGVGVLGDVNFDGVVNIFDVNLISSHWGESGPLGDANHDGIVNIFDVNVVSANWSPSAGGGAASVEESGGGAEAQLRLPAAQSVEPDASFNPVAGNRPIVASRGGDGLLSQFAANVWNTSSPTGAEAFDNSHSRHVGAQLLYDIRPAKVDHAFSSWAGELHALPRGEADLGPRVSHRLSHASRIASAAVDELFGSVGFGPALPHDADDLVAAAVGPRPRHRAILE